MLVMTALKQILHVSSFNDCFDEIDRGHLEDDFNRFPVQIFLHEIIISRRLSGNTQSYAVNGSASTLLAGIEGEETQQLPVE